MEFLLLGFEILFYAYMEAVKKIKLHLNNSAIPSNIKPLRKRLNIHYFEKIKFTLLLLELVCRKL